MRFTAHVRVVTSIAVSVVVASSSLAPADAAPARSCRLLQDAVGDDGLGGGEGGTGALPGTHDPALDIVSADVAASSTQLTVVIRVAAMGMPAAPFPYGGSWSFHFAAPEAAFYFDAGRTYDGDRFSLNHYTSEYSGDTSQSFLFEHVADVTGVIDGAAGEIRMTAPLSAFKPYDAITAGTVLKKLLVISWFEQGLKDGPVYPTGSEADETGGGGRATYRVGTRNCVTVGK